MKSGLRQRCAKLCLCVFGIAVATVTSAGPIIPDSVGTDVRKVSTGPRLAVGLFLGKIEEGARIFTPIRMIPKNHPESEGHEFPNALQLHSKEYDALVYLGELVGLKLTATLQRYPQQPTDKWWYSDFEEYSVDRIKNATVIRLPRSSAPMPGAAVVAFLDGQLIGFIIDTRNLTLEERGMTRPTSAGIDLTREEFLHSLHQILGLVDDRSDAVVVFD